MRALVAAWMVLAATAVRADVEGWPFDEVDRLAATLEFKEDGTGYFVHPGIDVSVPSGESLPSAPFAVVTVAGVCADPCPTKESYCPPTTALNIDGIDGKRYEYTHLACNTLTDEFLAFAASGPIPKGTKIAQVQKWSPPCVDADHLHYVIRSPSCLKLTPSQELANYDLVTAPPLTLIPFEDVEPPEVEAVRFARDDKNLGDWDDWIAFPSDPSKKSCVRVDGDVDIIARVADWFRDDHAEGHGDNLAPRRVSYFVCDAKSRCIPEMESIPFDSIPGNVTVAGTEVRELYSIRKPWLSVSDYCSNDVFEMIVTNAAERGPNPIANKGGAWKTSTGCFPDGHYTVSVVAEDYAHNKGIRSVPACVHNVANTPCPAKLLVRDCDGPNTTDDGAEPPSCTTWQSPDILLNPYGVGQGTLVAGHDNTIRVCIRNAGCGDVDLGKKIVVEAWTYPAAAAIPNQGDPGTTSIPSVSYPDQQSAFKDRNGVDLSPAMWPPGEERCLDLHWTPPPSLDPADVAGVAVVAYAPEWDAKCYGIPVTLDNNRAARDVGWESESPDAVEPPGDVGDVRRTDLSEIKTLLDRHVKLEAFACPKQTVGPRAQVLLGPGSVARHVVGGVWVGTITASEHASWDGSRPLESCSANPSGYMPCARAAVPSGARLWQVYSVDPAATDFELFGLEIQGVASVELHRFGLPEPGGRPCPEPILREFARRVTNGPEIEIGSRVLRPPPLVPARSVKRR